MKKRSRVLLIFSLVIIAIIMPYGFIIPDPSGYLLEYTTNCPDGYWCEVYIVDPFILIMLSIVVPVLIIIGLLVLYLPIPKRFRKKKGEGGD